MKYIVCKVRLNGSMVAGTPPAIHASYSEAVKEAERLMGDPKNEAQAFSVFQEVARVERVVMPVRTVDLR